VYCSSQSKGWITSKHFGSPLSLSPILLKFYLKMKDSDWPSSSSPPWSLRPEVKCFFPPENRKSSFQVSIVARPLRSDSDRRIVGQKFSVRTKLNLKKLAHSKMDWPKVQKFGLLYLWKLLITFPCLRLRLGVTLWCCRPWPNISFKPGALVGHFTVFFIGTKVW